MPLPPSGPITMGMINTELGYPATQIISLNDAAVRNLAGVPAGVISLSNFYGKSATVNKAWMSHGSTAIPAAGAPATPTGAVFNFSTESITLTTAYWPSTPGNFLYSSSWEPSRALMTGIAATPTTTNISQFLFTTEVYTASIGTYANNPIGPAPNSAIGNILQTNNASYTYRSRSSPSTITPQLRRYNVLTFSTLAVTYSPLPFLSPASLNDTASNGEAVNGWKNYAKGVFFGQGQSIRLSYPTVTTTSPGTNYTSTVLTGPFGVQSADNGFSFTGGGSSPTAAAPSHMAIGSLATETYTRLGINVGVVRASSTGFFNPTIGYFGGGYSPPAAGPFTFFGNFYRFPFATQTIASIPASVPVRYGVASLQGTSTLGT